METPLNVKSELTFSSPTPLSENNEAAPSISDIAPGTSSQSCSLTSTVENDRGGSAAEPAKENIGTKEDPIDGASRKGIFGWETLDGTSIPYLLRKGKKYVSIRIVERKLLSKYPNKSPDELGKKDPLVSHFITEAEASLLNEINVSHCDYEYGKSSFTKSDLVVDLQEFEEFFKLVKKTFPEEVLASMKGDVTTSPQHIPTPPEPTPPTPPVSTPTPCCGWVQINNTVSPYIMRGAGKNKQKLVPLSVIVYAAGLLTNANIKGILPSAEECKMLNAACKAAGFDFTFARNTRLISISTIMEGCQQVQIFELPVSNPLQHAQYLDQRMAPPAAPINPALRQSVPPPYPSVPMSTGMPMDGMGDRPPFFMNPFLPRFPGHDLSPNVRPGGMVPPGMNFDNRQAGTDQRLSNLDPSQLPVSIQQALLEKCHRLDSAAVAAATMNTMNKMSGSVRPPFWFPGQPPPAHSGKGGSTSKTPPSPFDSSLPSSSTSSSMQSSLSSYQPLSLPPNPLLHYTPLDLNHPIHRMPGMQSPPSTKDSNHPQNSNQGPSPSRQQSQGSQHSTSSIGANQINSSLFTRSECTESKKPTLTQPPPSVITSLHHQHSSHQTANKRQTPSPSQRKNVNNTNNNQNAVSLVKCISASLVNGKSISCLDVDSATRKGKYCLVEAVSKLYFPAVPIAEFLKVLIVVLNAKLYACTVEEEAAFVQYYNLPAPRLKCNQMILVDDLTRYFPQLNYVFSKRNTNHISPEEANGDKSQKRAPDSSLSGPPLKQAAHDTMMQKMQADKQTVRGDSTGTTNGSTTGSVIVIDD